MQSVSQCVFMYIKFLCCFQFITVILKIALQSFKQMPLIMLIICPYILKYTIIICFKDCSLSYFVFANKSCSVIPLYIDSCIIIQLLYLFQPNSAICSLDEFLAQSVIFLYGNQNGHLYICGIH